MRQKVFIMAYARANVGDDLFIITLLEKYKDINFYIGIKEKSYAKAFEKYTNVKIIENLEENFDNKNPQDYDAYIYVGGSIFMEGGKVYNLDKGCNEFMKKCYQTNIPFFYISSNFGPYQTQEYFDLATDTYKYCRDICFRDRYSYELFKDIPTVRYAPDLMFGIQEDNRNIIKDTVGISIIDMSIREKLKYFEQDYIECMVTNIKVYIEQGKKVYLYSFCKEENDEVAIQNILRRIPEQYKDRVATVFYEGNIDGFLEKYRSMEYMICCRFHAKILSAAYGQKMFILSYSKKIDNVIQDLQLANQYLRIEDLKSNTTIELNDFEQLDKSKIDEIKEKSKQQLAKIDEWYEKEVRK